MSSTNRQLAHLVGVKALVFFAGPDAHDVAELRQAERGLPVPPLVTFRLLTAVGLAGLVACALRPRRPSRPTESSPPSGSGTSGAG